MMSSVAIPHKLNTSTPTKSWRPITGYSILIVCASLYLLPFMRLMFMNSDEGTLLSGAVRVYQGQVFGRDFFEVIGPGAFYLLAAFFKLFGVTFLASRVDLFLTSLGTVLLIYYLSRQVCVRYQALPCAIVVSCWFGKLWPGISHHMDSNFIALLACACAVLWEKRRGVYLLIASGGLAGITTSFHLPKGILLFAALVVWIAVLIWRRSTSISSIVWVTVGYAGAVGVVLLYFWTKGALRDLIYANFEWPSQHYAGVNSVPYAQGLFQNYWSLWLKGMGAWYWAIPVASVLMIPLLFTAAVPGLLLAAGIARRHEMLNADTLLYLMCGAALWLSEIHRKEIAHLVFGSPLLVILCVKLLSDVEGIPAEKALQLLVISASFLTLFNLFLVMSAHTSRTTVGSVALFEPNRTLRFLEDHVRPGESIFTYPYCPIYYFLSSTENPTRFSILLYDYNTSSEFQEVISTLERRKVRYVVWNFQFEEDYIKSVLTTRPAPERGFRMKGYLESHYQTIWNEDGIRILERRSESSAK